MSKKLNIGFFSFTCCEGCVTVFSTLLPDHYDKWKKKVNIRCCKLLKSTNPISDLDVSFVEGAIATDAEVKLLKSIRKNSKYVVALGSGAITGQPSSYRNFFNAKLKKEISSKVKFQRENIQPIKDFIKVDDIVPGCPILEESFLSILDKYISLFNTKSNNTKLNSTKSKNTSLKNEKRPKPKSKIRK